MSKKKSRALNPPRLLHRSGSPPKRNPLDHFTFRRNSLLVERVGSAAPGRTGSSRILRFAVAASAEWSDFPVKGIFVPFCPKQYFTPPREEDSLMASPSVAVGEQIDIPLHDSGRRSAPAPRRHILRQSKFDPEGKGTLGAAVLGAIIRVPLHRREFRSTIAAAGRLLRFVRERDAPFADHREYRST